MIAVSVYRTLLLVRGSWWALLWFIRWSNWIQSYQSLFVHVVFSVVSLIVLTGLWLFRRWARWALLFLMAPRNRLRRSSIILFRCPCSYALRHRSGQPYRCGVVFAADKRDVRKTGPNQAMQLTATRRMLTL